MSTIRTDLDGVVVVTTDSGMHILKAGDEVPEGVTIGEHLLAEVDVPSEDGTEPTELTEPTEAAVHVEATPAKPRGRTGK